MQDCCNSKNIVTNEYQKNSYTASNTIANMSPGVHIDHIFARSSENIALSIIDYVLPLTETIPGQNFSYSDHEAVLARLHLKDAEHNIGEGACSVVSSINNEHHISEEASFKTDGCLISRRVAVLHDSISLCETSLDQLNVDRIFYYSVAVILGFILVVFLEYPSTLGFRTLYIILKLLVSGVLLFCIFMGSVWNYMEWNGILSGKVAMELMLRSIEIFENIPMK